MKHLILFLIFFSFSRSTASSSISLPPSSLDAQFLSFPKPEEDQPFSMLPVDVDPRLQQLCEGTEYPIKCLTTTISFLDDKAVVDPVSIVKQEVDAFYAKVKEALHKASKRLSNRSTSRFVTNRLKSCIDDYKTILKNKQKIIFDAISMGDTNKLIKDLNSNVDNIYASEDEFKEANIKFPIEMDSLLGRMIINSLSIGVTQHLFKGT
ncbi:hypothetical protein J1N35_016600 [Gossypium stocksii]|uniref:Pectinesterase inhibitor domain-containing protein n=1 Tax=Gossypium stocksii TaxID=47602 RepID=A0A9D3VMD6_9ROSI|nr:hypothetical protein J1N35_016600 [Gossypium stocksii]